MLISNMNRNVNRVNNGDDFSVSINKTFLFIKKKT